MSKHISFFHDTATIASIQWRLCWDSGVAAVLPSSREEWSWELQLQVVTEKTKEREKTAGRSELEKKNYLLVFTYDQSIVVEHPPSCLCHERSGHGNGSCEL